MIFLNKHSEFHGISLGKLGILRNSQGKSGIPGMQICVPGICHLCLGLIGKFDLIDKVFHNYAIPK